jgi:hypothetical protein
MMVKVSSTRVTGQRCADLLPAQVAHSQQEGGNEGFSG